MTLLVISNVCERSHVRSLGKRIFGTPHLRMTYVLARDSSRQSLSEWQFFHFEHIEKPYYSTGSTWGIGCRPAWIKTNPDWRQLSSVGIRFYSCGATANAPSAPGRIIRFLYMLEMKELSFWKALPWRISCQNVCHSKVWSTEDSLTKWANMRSLTYVRDDKQCHSDDHREEESLPQAIITWDSSYTLGMIERGNSSHSVYGLGSEWQTPLPRHKKEMNLYLINRNRL